MNNESHKLHMASGRLEALGDGIFSVAMTILVIELKIPAVKENSFNDLLQGLYETRLELFCFFISFIILGIMWFGHRMVFEYISQINRYFIFLGVLFYMVWHTQVNFTRKGITLGSKNNGEEIIFNFPNLILHSYRIFIFFPLIGIAIYFITPILYLLPNKLDKYLP